MTSIRWHKTRRRERTERVDCPSLVPASDTAWVKEGRGAQLSAPVTSTHRMGRSKPPHHVTPGANRRPFLQMSVVDLDSRYPADEHGPYPENDTVSSGPFSSNKNKLVGTGIFCWFLPFPDHGDPSSCLRRHPTCFSKRPAQTRDCRTTLGWLIRGRYWTQSSSITWCKVETLGMCYKWRHLEVTTADDSTVHLILQDLPQHIRWRGREYIRRVPQWRKPCPECAGGAG